MTYNQQVKGLDKYPKEELVRWLSRVWGSVPDQYRAQTKFLVCGYAGSLNLLHSEGFSGFPTDKTTNLQKLHYPDHYFDAVVDILAASLNIEFSSIFKEYYRVLKKGGRLFSMVPTFDCYQFPFDDYDSVQFFAPEAVRRALNGMFEFSIGYSHTLDPSEAKNHVLRLWVIDAVKV